MAFFQSGKKSEPGVSLVANNCEIEGDIHFSDQLLINGIVKGNIYAREGVKAVVTVSEKGCVEGEIHVSDVIINGKVFGDIYSDKHVELAAKAEIKGNVYYDLIEMVMGSRVDGKLVKICAGEDANQQTAAKAEPSPVNSTDNEDQVETKDALASQKSPLHVTSVKSKTA